MLSYEEIMASTPPIDLDVGIPKASAIKTITNNINNQILDIEGIPLYSFESLGVAPDNNENFFKAWINKIKTSHSEKLDKPIIAKVSPNVNGIVVGHIYNDGNYSAFLYIPVSNTGNIFFFGYYESNWIYRSI